MYQYQNENLKADVDTQNFMVQFRRQDMDCSAFAINKAIAINNIQRYQNLNGKYLLYRKVETYNRIADTFILNTFIYLKRIDSSGDKNHKSGSGSFFSFICICSLCML